ncbi:MAG: AMP-binding protein [Polaromonas sp.]|nr:AMP-binding protein [Polaromonas sp.]
MKRSQNRDNAAGPSGQPEQLDHYAALHQGFRWQVDDTFNIAEVCCSRWARHAAAGHSGHRAVTCTDAIKDIAVCAHRTGAGALFHTYRELQADADALSHALVAMGVQRGDRVAIVMPQRFETAVAYMAVFQMGAVAMPLSMLFGPEALEYRLQDSEAVIAISDESSITSLNAVRAKCPALRCVLAAGTAAGQGDADYAAELARHRRAFAAVKTKAEEAAILIYTSGTTGPPKGALLPHRALIGNLTGFVCSQNWFGFDGISNDQSDAVFWSPADWAWTGGLMDALLPTLYFGRPIVAYNGRFSPELAFTLMQERGVTHTFLFPTALKAMMKAYPRPREHFGLQLQAMMSAGEAVGDAVFAYCRDELGVVVNEMFGQTEINYVVGNCSMQWAPAATGTASAAGKRAAPALAAHRTQGRGWPARPGSMGKGYPGHRVAVIDEAGNECADGVPGDVAVNRFDVHGDPDPIFFLGYWKNDTATQAKFTGDWCRTGDLARRDADGYLWYEGRADDVFKAAGYRIGPGEIENCLVKHLAVANAAVVPKPDRERGAVVKAFVVLAPDFVAERPEEERARATFDAKLTASLQDHVKALLAPYEYPKEIEFIDALPMTTTGKVQRRVLRLQEEERFKALRPAAGSSI